MFTRILAGIGLSLLCLFNVSMLAASVFAYWHEIADHLVDIWYAIKRVVVLCRTCWRHPCTCPKQEDGNK